MGKKTTGPPPLGLVMIVKDEAERIVRCLQSVEPFIDTWTICDTGSTDDTKALVEQTLGHIPGRLVDHEWGGFGPSLTTALAEARCSANWLLRMDADMTFWCDVTFDFRKWMKRRRAARTDALYVELREGGDTWDLPLMVQGDLDWRYVGPTHEYLDLTGRNWMKLRGVFMEHHADGTRRPEKFTDDLALLAPGVAAGEPRAIFYSAECLRFLGRTQEAIEMYQRRALIDDFEEERWWAQFQAANLRRNIAELYATWHQRKWRHEPLTAAARIAASLPAEANDVLWRQPIP